MATDSSILAWRIPRTEEPGGLQSMGVARVGHDLATKLLLLLSFIGLSRGISDQPASVGDTRDVGSIPGQEDPLEKEMATHFSILAWRIPWTEMPGGLQSMESQIIEHNLVTNIHKLCGNQ